MTKTKQILGFIKEGGLYGRSFGEIQRFIVELNGRNYDEFETVYDFTRGKNVRKRVNRGYYCTNLVGRNGLFKTHGVKKNVVNRWVA